MFTDDFCEDWDSTKNQDDFIKRYFRKRKVNSTKAATVLKSEDKAKNIGIIKNSKTKLVKHDSEYNCETLWKSCLLKNKQSLNQEGCNKKRMKEQISLHDSSQKNCPEMFSQPQIMQGIESSESDHLKNKKKKKLIKKKKYNSNESLEQMSITENSNSKTKTTIGNFSIDLTKNVDLHSIESDSNYLKLKKKKKRLRNKAKTVSEEKSPVSDKLLSETETISDTMLCDASIMENNLSGHNYDSNCLKKKKEGFEKSSKHDKFSNQTELTSIEESNHSSVKKPNLLQNKAYQKLQAAKFRYLNEMLYTNSGKDALSYFQQNTDEFVDYHEGYQSQVSKWPVNPVDIIIQEISQINKQAVIADLGCGQAKIAEVFPNRTVYSFDLIALKDCVTACDMTNVPLQSNCVDVVVFCLSLMGTNWKDYLKEGHRILKPGGTMKIAEIESRIENVEHFIKEIQNVGFSLINENLSHRMFVFLNFKKVKKNKKTSKVPAVTLKPCMYKKR